MEPAELSPSHCLLRHLEAEPLQPVQHVQPLQPLQPLGEDREAGEAGEGGEGGKGVRKAGRAHLAEGTWGDHEGSGHEGGGHEGGAIGQGVDDDLVLRAGQWARAALFGFDSHGNALPL